MRKILAVALVLFSVQVMADEDRWVNIGSHENDYIYYVDKSTLKVSTNESKDKIISAWNISLKKGGRLDTNNTSMAKTDYNCSKGRMMVIKFVRLDDGRVASTMELNKDVEVVPYTSGESLFNAVCKSF